MKVFIKTYGCQMNEYDSDFVKSITEKMHFTKTDTYQDADLIVINTCSIREKASEKLYSELGRINRHKQYKIVNQNKYTVIAVIGCVAQADGKAIFERAPFVDIVIGPQGYHKFEEVFNKAVKQKDRQVVLDFTANEKFDYIAGENSALNTKFKNNLSKPSVFVTIQEGCDRFCTFCVVPYTRGPEVSRNAYEILDEVKILAEHGAKEVILLGQNVNAYHGKGYKGTVWNLAQLISEIALIDGIKRIKYTTSHPCYMDNDLMAVHGSEPKLMPVLNLPVQSGSNKILHNMNRKHDRDYYINIIKTLRKMRPEIVISSDFIVGFPGETNEDFEDTLSLVRQVVFTAQSFAFKYSIRTGTPASLMEQVPEEIKSERLAILQEVLKKQRSSFVNKLLGKKEKVLFDDPSMKKTNQIGGRTEFGDRAIVSEITPQQYSQLNGKIRKTLITSISANSLNCELID